MYLLKQDPVPNVLMRNKHFSNSILFTFYFYIFTHCSHRFRYRLRFRDRFGSAYVTALALSAAFSPCKILAHQKKSESALAPLSAFSENINIHAYVLKHP
jgi:hypothetical protein